jgi:hypothetical protein
LQPTEEVCIPGISRGRIPIVAAFVVAMVASNTASADIEVGAKDNGFSVADETYLKTYKQAHKAGFDVGRNLLDSAWSDAEPVSDKRIRASTATLQRWLNPPEPVTAAVSESVAPAPVAETVAPSSGGCPASMAPESGSAGYSAYNPASGATGCYQVIPSTAAAHNCDLSTPAGQDACAAAICATQGNAAWSASGATPC